MMGFRISFVGGYRVTTDLNLARECVSSHKASGTFLGLKFLPYYTGECVERGCCMKDLTGLNHSEVYSRLQCDDDVTDGMTFKCDGAVGFIFMDCYPVVVKGKSFALHGLADNKTWADVLSGCTKYNDDWMKYYSIIRELLDSEVPADPNEFAGSSQSFNFEEW